MSLDRTVIQDAALGLEVRRGQLLLFAACDSAYVEYASALVRGLDVFSPGSESVFTSSIRRTMHFRSFSS